MPPILYLLKPKINAPKEGRFYILLFALRCGIWIERADITFWF